MGMMKRKCYICLEMKQTSKFLSICYDCLKTSRVFVQRECNGCGSPNTHYNVMRDSISSFHQENPNAMHTSTRFRCQHCNGIITAWSLPESYKCAGCGKSKPYSEFMATQFADMTERCNDCNNQRTRKDRQNNPTKYRSIARKSHANNRETHRHRQHRRRAQKAQIDSSLTSEQWQFALDYFNGSCAICGKPPGLWHFIARDHWLPFSKGGGYGIGNIIPLCHALKDGSACCNNLKSNKDPEQWVIKTYGEKKGGEIISRINEYFEAAKAKFKPNYV